VGKKDGREAVENIGRLGEEVVGHVFLHGGRNPIEFDDGARGVDGGL
jgi:hypothetical protein